MRSIMLFALILITACGSASQPRVHTSPTYQFTIPSNWQTMAELWGSEYQKGKEYNQLGVMQEVMITSVRQRGEFGAWFAVASAPLPAGKSLEQTYRAAYASHKAQFRKVSEETTSVAGSAGFAMIYQRPSGEPWWQYRDVWLDHDGVVYVLSIHYLPGHDMDYQQAYDQMIGSFGWQATQ